MIGQGQATQDDPLIIPILIVITVVGLCLMTALHARSQKIRTYAVVWAAILTFAAIATVILTTPY